MKDHDQAFKKLLMTFYEEFIQLFFPDVAEQIDFGVTEFMMQDVLVDVVGNKKHTVDLLIKTRLKGEEGYIAIHLEPQSYSGKEFPERMYWYFSRLYEIHKIRILPIAVFSEHINVPDEYTISFPFLEVMKFKFLKVELKKKNWREYIQSDNPVAAALMANMAYNENEKIQVKIEFLRMMLRLQMDPAKESLILSFFDYYLELDEQGEEEVLEILRQSNWQEDVKVMEMIPYWERKGRELGREEGRELGREEGREEGKKSLLLRLLQKKFGSIPKEIKEAIDQTPYERLEKVEDALFDIQNIDEIKKWLN